MYRSSKKEASDKNIFVETARLTVVGFDCFLVRVVVSIVIDSLSDILTVRVAINEAEDPVGVAAAAENWSRGGDVRILLLVFGDVDVEVLTILILW